MADAKEAGTEIAKPTRGCTRIIFIHGFLDGASIWDAVRDRLAPVGLYGEAVDLAGMGGTEAAPESISLDRYVDDVVARIGEGDAPVVLVGQSMGAQVADLVATRRPDLVAGLILLTPVPLAGVHLPVEAVTPFKQSGGKPEAQRALREQLSFFLQGEQADALTALALRVKPDVVARLVDVWNEGHAAGREPKRYSGPVLILRGSADPFVNDDLGGESLKRYPGAKSLLVNDAGHWAHVEQPSTVAVAIGSFVAALNNDGARSGNASDWQTAFADQSASSFANAFADDVELDASVMLSPVRGRDQVMKVMEAASRQYSELLFTDRAIEGARQYLEWRATGHDGVAYRGVTILTRDPGGAVRSIAIHHRPLAAAMHFSRALAEALHGVIAPDHFLETSASS